jgi:hypothetical protein
MEFNTNEITLKFLANSVYKDEVNKNSEANIKLEKKEYKFYKKRVYRIIKDMMKNNYPNESMKNTHTILVKQIIQYIKHLDTAELIQKEYSEDLNNNNNNNNNNVNENTTSILIKDDIDEANKSMMKQSTKDFGTLDNFVNVKKIKLTNKIFLPKKKNLNIKTKQHKRKGIKKKNRKKEKQSEE